MRESWQILHLTPGMFLLFSDYPVMIGEFVDGQAKRGGEFGKNYSIAFAPARRPVTASIRRKTACRVPGWPPLSDRMICLKQPKVALETINWYTLGGTIVRFPLLSCQ
jgi:hypothetical protein